MSSAEDSLVTYEMRGDVAIIGLNRPEKRNAISDRFVEAIGAAVLRATAEAVCGGVEHLTPAPDGAAAALKPWIKALRPRQWAKNALIFAPLLAAHQVDGLGACIAAFIAFSLLASSVYLVNDMLDLKADRAHPRKRERPFAAAAIPIGVGAAAAPGGSFWCN